MSQSGTILIIDDDQSIRAMLQALLSDEGYTLVTAANGQEGFRLAQATRPDVILLDVCMPGLNGYDVCRMIRGDADIAEVPVVMLTALNDREARLDGIRAGADDFIPKPFDCVELSARLHTITRLNRFRRLLAERERFQWIVEHAEDGFLLLDPQGMIRYANPTARLYLGLTSDDTPSAPFRTVIEQQYHCEPADTWCTWPEPLTAGLQRFLIRPEMTAQPACWVSVESAALHHATDDDLLVCLRDVTSKQCLDRHHLTFQSMITHKLLTPLNGILPMLQLLAEDAATLAPEEIESYIEPMVQSADRLFADVTQVLQFLDASILASAGNGLCTSAALRDIIRRVGAELQLTRVAVELVDDLPCPLTIAPSALELILYQLLHNAQKFHPVQTPSIAIAGACAAGEFRLTVSDDGIHLSPEQLMRVWMPYYQYDRWKTGEIGGMGLGLPLVASLLWSIGGHCRIRNRGDQPGVCVELDLPIQVTETVPAPG